MYTYMCMCTRSHACACRPAARPLLLCPCCMKDEMEADLEVEVLAPVGIRPTLSALEAKVSTLDTLASLISSDAPARSVAAASSNKAGSGVGKSKGKASAAGKSHTLGGA